MKTAARLAAVSLVAIAFSSCATDSYVSNVTRFHRLPETGGGETFTAKSKAGTGGLEEAQHLERPPREAASPTASIGPASCATPWESEARCRNRITAVMDGKAKVVVENGRVDIVTETHAIEVARAFFDARDLIADAHQEDVLEVERPSFSQDSLRIL